jgi:hypothetical protein
MYWRVTAALLTLVVLACTHWKAYVEGKQIKQAEFNQMVANATQRFREREQAMVDAKQKAEEAHEQDKRKSAAAAVAARNELDRLRLALAGRGRAAQDPAAQPRVDDTGAAERELLGACAGELQTMAAEADRLAVKVTGLQGYVAGVCAAH